jgi:ankyrin repeat protein
MDLEKISALFEKRLEKIEKDFKEQATQVNSLREDNVKLRDKVEKQNEIITRLDGDNVMLREEAVKQNDIIIRLDGELALLRQENTLLNSTVSRLEIDNAEARGDLRILHPLPYARLHLQHCIERQEACNAELNAFHHRYLTDTIISNPVLTVRERELRAALKAAWDARFAAAHLCEPPPTLVKTLWILAKNGFEEEIKKCLNLNKATRTCKQLQALMREVKGKYGLTQLNYFANEGMIESVNRMLLIKGIEIESKDVGGNTPLINAAAYGHVEICKLLLDHGAKIESKSYVGATPLLSACQEGRLSVVSLLIDRGAEVEARKNDGNTPLISAAFDGHVEICKLLLDHGAKIESKCNLDYTPLLCACLEGQLSVINLLIDRGADVEASNMYGFRPLHIAARYDHLKIVKALIARHVDMNAPLTNDGWTALGIARREKHASIISYLQSLGALDDGIVDEEEEEEEEENEENDD